MFRSPASQTTCSNHWHYSHRQQTCQNPQFGYGNILLDRTAHSCSVLLCLKKTLSGYLVACILLPNGSDACKVGFTLRGHAVGVWACFLDRILVQMLKVSTPEHLDRLCCLLYHRNHGYNLAEFFGSHDN